MRSHMALSSDHLDVLSRTMRRMDSAQKARDLAIADYVQACAAWRAHTTAGKNLKKRHEAWAKERAEVQHILDRNPRTLLAWARETARRVAALDVDLAVVSVGSIEVSEDDLAVLHLKHENAVKEAREALDEIMDYKNETERTMARLALLNKKEPPMSPFNDDSREYAVCENARARCVQAKNKLDKLKNVHSGKRARFIGEALEKELVE